MNPSETLLRTCFPPLWVALVAVCRSELAEGRCDPLRAVARAVCQFETICRYPLAVDTRAFYVRHCMLAYVSARRLVDGRAHRLAWLGDL